METNNENASMRASGLKPPTKFNYSPPKSGLSEMSQSVSNSRVMPPPQYPANQKHKISGLPESVPKQRKTLSDRAGEPIHKNPAAPPSSQPVNGSVKSLSRNASFSSSTSRVPSASSRNTSTLSFGHSVGPGSKPPYTANNRPRTAYGHNRSASQQSLSRPGTSQDNYNFGNDQDGVGKRKEPIWDPSRIDKMEQDMARFSELAQTVEGAVTERDVLRESIDIYKSRINELEQIKAQLISMNSTLQADLEDKKVQLSASNKALEDVRRTHTFEVDDLRRKHRNDMEDVREQYRREAEKRRNDNDHEAQKARKEFEGEVGKLIRLHKEELGGLERRLKAEVEEERSRSTREVLEAQNQFALKLQNASLDLDTKEREAQTVRGELIHITSELDREKSLKANLQDKIMEAAANNLALETANRAMKAKIDFLESDNQAQSQAFADLHRRMQEAIETAALANEKLRVEETLRRKLHNQVQELKGNIRVFCRVRPLLEGAETEPAKIAFPDADSESKEVVVQGPEQRSALGNVTTATNPFSFDRVFGPASQNAEVFEEISQLVQSALDGYNVCIFCYGQTGSGKTHTMSAADGMIPRAVQQIYAEATRLEEKGWRYNMAGSFIEVYNENLNDLLGKSEDLDKKKLEIRHDTAKKQTTITDVTTVELDGPERVEQMLKLASNNRSVAATKANERSSRSHSVFILKLVGENSITGERSEGTLNLVDLAGSERLAHSQAQGERLKETQNINKSLSCLGDVINALGSSKENAHIPYRNSKLTYLLQYSLGGNSKTLMFVMVSPLQAHLQETITSLKFATKVHNTHIGTAKKQTKTKD
ncbi:putative kinesin family protein [Lepidopterella palustris CBS 459.81]|uniref:Kinesin-like protein n=1 Tax=Lepidopterella palustris CBS 459.81 TaxID=1314670 RepID=A0A8E2EG94_9PEZI|nr:putative kinesin family protein [Lepidopterella palustris CBS 459.81]